MKIKFLIDYIGRETAMKEYPKDFEADIPDAQALELIRLGVAEEVVVSFVPESRASKYKPKAKDYDHDKNAS